MTTEPHHPVTPPVPPFPPPTTTPPLRSPAPSPVDTLPPPPSTTPPPPSSWAAGPPPGGGTGGQGGGPHAERPLPRPHALATAPRPEQPPHPATAPRPPRTPARLATLTASTILGTGLIVGAAAGSWLASDAPRTPTASTRFADARTAWRSVPVDTLFPRALKGSGAGPGGADRAWTRVAVAPDSTCTNALDPLLLKALGPVGCTRLLRATYTDATTSSVTTVGMVFTQADEAATNALRTRFAREKLAERTDLMPRTFPVPGTVAAGFGDGQRASWAISILKDVPVVVYAVSGFADGRTVTDPQPATLATAVGATSAPAESGLAHEAKGIADRVERGLRRTVNSPTEQPG